MKNKVTITEKEANYDLLINGEWIATLEKGNGKVLTPACNSFEEVVHLLDTIHKELDFDFELNRSTE